MKYTLMLFALIVGVHGRYPPRSRRVYGAEPPQSEEYDDVDSVPEGDRVCDRVCPEDAYRWISVCAYWPEQGKFYNFVSKCQMESWNSCFLTNFVSLGESECKALRDEDRYRFWEYDMEGNKLSDEELRKFNELMNDRKPRDSPKGGSLKEYLDNKRTNKRGKNN